jgi:hypothetical protein
MPVTTKSTANMPTKNSYVPPSLRGKPAPLLTTKKTQLKKEFAIEQNAFPSLGDTIKKNTNAGTPISFSSAAAKKIEPPKIIKIDVLPGWVHIRRHAGQIQYKYGEPVYRSYANEERDEEILSRIIVKNRIAREQYDRNREIDRLGDLSEFYGQLTLAEIYENEASAFPINDSESSDYSDSDHYYENYD